MGKVTRVRKASQGCCCDSGRGAASRSRKRGEEGALKEHFRRSERLKGPGEPPRSQTGTEGHGSDKKERVARPVLAAAPGSLEILE